MAELHLIGRISGAQGFEEEALFCKWALQYGSGWRVVTGHQEGQTQVDKSDPLTDTSEWCHPVDVHFACRGLQGWPRFMLQVYREDRYGRRDLCGYGVVHLPTKPGQHTLTCNTWRPVGSFLDEVRRVFVGGAHQLLSTELIYSPTERFKLHTVPSGKVFIEAGLILRNFDKNGILY